MLKNPKHILAFMLLLVPALVFSCGRKGVVKADKTPPAITATSPEPGGIAPPNGAISITFSEPVNAETIQLILSSGTALAPCSLSYSGATAVFTPAAVLAANAEYTATISAGVADLAGNIMPEKYVLSFRTAGAADSMPPEIRSVAPPQGSTSVDATTGITVVFSEPVDERTILFALKAGEAPVSCAMNYSRETAVFTPGSPLAPDTEYRATIGPGLADLAKNELAREYSWTFRTAAQAPPPEPPPPTDATAPSVVTKKPAPGATGVDRDTTISVTFTESVVPDTIEFRLTADGTSVACGLQYSGVEAIFTPDRPLAYDTLYTAELQPGIRDQAGNATTRKYAWTFRTEAGPVVYSIEATSGRDGDIVPSGTISVAHGEDVTFSIVPDKRHTIRDVRVDGESVGPVDSYTFHNVTSDHGIRASFEEDD